MGPQHFIIRFEGAEAEYHALGLRKLGESLIGIERIITIGLFTIATGRPPKHGEHLPFVVQASEPRRGSFEIDVLLSGWVALLPLFSDVFRTGASELVWRWVSSTMLKMGGRENDSEDHVKKLIELVNNLVDTVNTVNTQRHIETLEWQKLVSPARQVVSPIGSSCDRIIFLTRDEATEIDPSIAEVIRSRDRLKVGGTVELLVKVVGFTHYNRRLKVLLLKEPSRIITALVRDPAFDNVPNIYAKAATNQEWLTVTAKVRLKDGRIKELYIMDAQAVRDRGK